MWWSNLVMIRNYASSTPWARPRLIVCAAALTAAVAACAAAPPAQVPGSLAVSATEQYALATKTAPDRIALAIHAQGLSPNQQVVLGDFLRRWRESGEGSIEIGAPGSGADPVLARRTADAVYAFLTRLGAPASSLTIVGYDPAGSPNPPVYARFSALQGEVFDCSKTWDNLTSTGDNRESTHFGCAVTSNMAAQVADPHDLVRPASSDQPDQNGRAVVLAKYRKGDVTSTNKDAQASGEVSQ